ncbi:MAG TPA: hypothetical protein VFQ53_33920 [Kofleriaceae bacterium]|nr:hypothetical protein [Kofleriaceae bacterium]
MRSLCLFAAVIASAASCSRDKPTGPATTATDAMWKYTPEAARGAIVISPRGMKLVENAWVDARAYLDQAGPELAPIKEQLDAILAPLGGTKVMLADLGMAATKGAALFFVKDGMIAILPVTDRDAFLAKVKGTKATAPDGVDRIDNVACKPLDDVYACATAEPLLATIGKGELKSKLARIGKRGEIELVGDQLPLGGAAPGTVAAIAQLSRGSATVRGIILNAPLELGDKLGTSQKPRTLAGRTAAFGLIDLRPLVADAPPEPIAEGVTFADVVKSLAGALTIVVPAGEATMDMQLPLSDPAAFTKIVDKCAEIPPLAAMSATSANGVCHLKIPEAGLELDAWLDGKLLRIGNKAAKGGGKSVPLSPVGSELATGDWGISFWGRGSMLAPASKQPAPDAASVDPRALAPVRILSLVNELGIGLKRDGDALRFLVGVRTQFANPDTVTSKLASITALDVLQNKASAKAQPVAVAAADADAPFADDFTAGQTGLLVPTTLLGFGTSVIIPMVMRYARGSSPDEDTAPTGAPTGAPVQGDGQYTKIVTMLYVTQAYPKWLEANPKKPCATLADLQKLMPGAGSDTPPFPTSDEWGHELVVKCGKDAPPAANGFGVLSGGPDGKVGTADDITSYDAPQAPIAPPPPPAPAPTP